MWICLSNAFFSIVEPARHNDDGQLLVRARRQGDIEQVFDVQAVRTVGRDYLYRAYINRDAVAKVIADQVLSISYGNFKNSVRNDELHDAYSSFWSIHSRLQEIPPYSSALYVQSIGRAKRGQERLL